MPRHPSSVPRSPRPGAGGQADHHNRARAGVSIPPGDREIAAIVVTEKAPTISILTGQARSPGPKPVRTGPAIVTITAGAPVCGYVMYVSKSKQCLEVPVNSMGECQGGV